MRKNASSADNQQERLEKIPAATAHYFSGFVDGEGSFNVALIPRNKKRVSVWLEDLFDLQCGSKRSDNTKTYTKIFWIRQT